MAPAAQLDTLLAVKSAVDKSNVLKDWDRAVGANGGFCAWSGVTCEEGSPVVRALDLSSGAGIEGLRGTLPPAAVLRPLGGLREIAVMDQPGISGGHYCQPAGA